MESELKDLNLKSNSPQPPPPPPLPDAGEDGFNRDDRPLLKSSAPISADNVQVLEQKFAAFVRDDVYGTIGCGELPWREKALLVISFLTVVPIRVALALSVLVLYYLICRACTLFSEPNPEDEEGGYAHVGGWRRSVIIWCGRVLSRIMLFVLGFYWITETYRIPDVEGRFSTETCYGNQTEEPGRPGAVISNHISYLDILYHTYSSFPSFVAKRSVANLPLVGLISKCLGCVYVQRESKSSKGVSGVVDKRVREAHQNSSAPMMMLFPEGTTSNGEYILPFKTGAFLSKAPVLPVILRYPYQRFSPAWDSISGVRHIILLLCQFVNYVEVTRLPIYYPSQQEKDDPRLYAANVRKLIAHEGDLLLSDNGLAEKRMYHAALGLCCQD
ncbi:Plasmalogen synthase [Bertholletia excelsa]